MKQITQANSAYLSILGKPKAADGTFRLMKYCAQTPVEDGVLLFNVPTREMVLLTEEEHADLLNSQYLRDHWFVVPENTNEKESVDMLRWVVENMQPKTGNITYYTILTTTDCNARCFYCFEKGCQRTHMTEETALKTAEYIRSNCGGKKVILSWFGGEPLYNDPVIDIICTELQKAGVEYTSEMISNGYLFNTETVKKATSLWALKNVQITLDGTEEVYNKSKAYIYKDGSAYQVVMSSINHLLDAGIKVKIRLNVDLYNAENLLQLVDELAARFGGRSGISIYTHHLYDIDTPSRNLHTSDEWGLRFDAMHRLEQRIASHGLASKFRIRSKLKTARCGADQDEYTMILPTGELGRCRDYIDSPTVGHLDTGITDPAMCAGWKERMPAIDECSSCAYYPDCIRLKKCLSTSECFPQFREDKLLLIEKCMLGEYQKWLRGETAEEAEEENLSHQ